MQDPRPRMRELRTAQHLRGQELVVRRQQGTGTIEDADVPRRERPQRPEPVLDAVEAVDDVQPTERDGAGLEQRRGLVRREDARVDPARGSGGEADVRGSATLGDDREQHDFSIAENARTVGYGTVKIRCASGGLRM